MPSMLTQTQRYAAGGLLGLALHQAKINQTNPFCHISDQCYDVDGDETSTVDLDSQLCVHNLSHLLRPIFRGLGIDETSWPGLEETFRADSANRNVRIFISLLAEESDDASSEVKEHELALSKAVDNVVSSIGDSMDLKAKKEKHREYADECREKFSSDARNEMEEKGLQDPLIDKENRPSIKVAPIGTGSKFAEKPFEEVEMLNYPKKVAILYELLAACLVLKPDADSKSIQRRDGYDARHRVALRLLTAWLNINWINMEALGTIIASSAMSTLKEEECTERKTQNKKDSWANWKRGSIIGAAALTGGTVFAITGGLAAPGIAAGFGALTPVSLHVAATAATTHIAVAASLGAAGAGLSGMKMASRIGNLEDFEFRVVGENNNQSRLAVEILISGFVFEEEDYIRPWEGQANNSERYALQWESKNLIAVSTAIQDWLTTQLTIMTMKQGAMLTVLHSLVSALAWPTALLNVLDLIDSKWSIAIDRSDQAGILLAEEVLLKGLHGQRPVTLIGFSLGARVIFKCLQTLAEAKCDAGLVERVVLLGSPISIKDESWKEARKVVAGRFVNAYSTNDWLLGVVFRASLLSQGLAGIQAVDTPGIENIDVTDLVEGHSSYLWTTQQIMEKIEIDAYFPASDAYIAEPRSKSSTNSSPTKSNSSQTSTNTSPTSTYSSPTKTLETASIMETRTKSSPKSSPTKIQNSSIMEAHTKISVKPSATNVLENAAANVVEASTEISVKPSTTNIHDKTV